jgi:5'-nucleotidase / UDP-sugar diphosphatase
MRCFFGMVALLAVLATACASERTIRIIHFSDYHSHAVPFLDGGENDVAGIARAIAYMSSHGDDALIFSGGDMINRGSPAWSDRYRCIEWGWLNGLVDAMAFGNHDADYGADEFARCARSTRYPILSANTSGLSGIDRYAVFRENGVRVGVFAVAGREFPHLVKVPGVAFGDPVAAASEVVRKLRREERADLVVMIGHQQTEEDEALARAVPGIDIIFGTHSHRKSELRKIEGTETWTISPFQYLTYLSDVVVSVDRGGVRDVTGGLVRMSAELPQDRETAVRVARLQRELEADPQYAPLFSRIATLERAVTPEALGELVTRIMREAAGTDLALSTASSFRRGLPAGEIREDDLQAALPYPNRILVYTLRGREVQALIDLSASFAGTDLVARISFRGTPPLDPGAEYLVAVTDYMARTAEKYRDFFAPLTARDTGLEVREEVRKRITAGTARSGR